MSVAVVYSRGQRLPTPLFLSNPVNLRFLRLLACRWEEDVVQNKAIAR